MAKVRVINGNFEQAIRRFRKAVENDNVIQTFKEKMYFEKPSEKRKRQKNRRKRA